MNAGPVEGEPDEHELTRLTGYPFGVTAVTHSGARVTLELLHDPDE